MWFVKQHNKYLGSKLVAQHLLNLPTTQQIIFPAANKSQQIIIFPYMDIYIYIYIYILSTVEAITASF